MATKRSRSNSNTIINLFVALAAIGFIQHAGEQDACAQSDSSTKAIRLFRVVSAHREYRDSDGKREWIISPAGTHYTIQFTEDDPFEFIMSRSYLISFHNGNRSKKATMHRDDDGNLYMIPNRLLRVRAAMLAAKSYFDHQCIQAKIKQRFAKEGPIKVYVGGVPPGSRAYAAFDDHTIVFRPQDLIAEVAIHEYFHLVHSAIWFQDSDHRTRLLEIGENNQPWGTYLGEMSAEWATDEPIIVPATPGFPKENLDLVQHYQSKGSAVLRWGHISLINAQNHSHEYRANLLLKYWAEQMAGGQDSSAATDMLRLCRRVFELGGATRENYLQALTEPLIAPFQGKDPDATWHKFFRYFCASNIVQNARMNVNPELPLGYHDEAFQKTTFKNSWYGKEETFDVFGTKQTRYVPWSDEYQMLPDLVWAVPAETDETRFRRLDPVLRQPEPIRYLAHKTHLLNLNRTQVARAVCIYAKGEPGTDVYLLNHKTPMIGTPSDRRHGTFELLDEFNFLESSDKASHQNLIFIENYKSENSGNLGPRAQNLWLGLVNSSTAKKKHSVSWMYFASPRLVRSSAETPPTSTATIALTNGPALLRNFRNELPVFQSGDEFEFSITTTSPLHHKNAKANTELTHRDVAISLKFLTKDHDIEVPFEITDGHALKFKYGKVGEHWNYQIKGKIPDRSDYEGQCRMRLRISSPWNLGKPDEEIDESFEFFLSAAEPFLDRLEVRHGAQLIYDNTENIRQIPKSKRENLKLRITATFSRDMDQKLTTIFAGGEEPFNRYQVKPLEWISSRVCEGWLTIPKSEISPTGMILRFSVNGQTSKNSEPVGHIDSDVFTPGHQPDTSHFLIVGLNEYWEVTRTEFSQRSRNFSGNDRQFAEQVEGLWGPIRESTRLVNRGYDGFTSTYAKDAVHMLQRLDKNIELARKSVKQLREKHDLAVREKKPQEELKFISGKLLRQRKILGLMTLRVRPLMEALVRLESGYRWLQWHPELSGPIALEFNGINVGWTSFSNQSQFRKSGQLFTSSIQTSSTRRFMDPGQNLHNSEVYAWNFWPSDVRKVEQLIYLTHNLPDYVTKVEPQSSMIADSGRYHEYVGSALDYDLNSDSTLAYHLYDLSCRLWAHVPPSHWPFDPDVLSPTKHSGQFRQKTQDQWRQLPKTNKGRLIHLWYGNMFPEQKLPIRYEVMIDELGFGDDGAGESFETKDDREIQTQWWPQGQHTFTRTSHNVSTTIPWRRSGFGSRKYRLFYDSIIPSDGVSVFDVDEKPRWSILNRNCRIDLKMGGSHHRGYGENKDILTVLMQPESDLASATIMGTLQVPANLDQPSDHAFIRWNTSWTIKRIGNPLKPDPNSQLPEWDESLGPAPSLVADADTSNENHEKSPSKSKGEKQKKNVKTEGGRERDGSKEINKSKTEWESIESTTYDSVNGLVTEVRRNSDNSWTVMTEESNGKVSSNERVNSADPRRIFGPNKNLSSMDSWNVLQDFLNNKVSGLGERSVLDSRDNTFSPLTAFDRKQSSVRGTTLVSRTGNTTSSVRMPNGDVKITTRDSSGKVLRDFVIRSPK